MRYILLLLMLFSLSASAQKVGLSIGTDAPYQHYAAVSFHTENIAVSYRTGLLLPPYSDLALNVIEGLGTEEVYIDLVESSFDFGWMNSLGVYYKPGRGKSWYLGPEFRLDHLAVSNTSYEIIEVITGETIDASDRPDEYEIVAELGLTMYALGIRIGKAFALDEDRRHHINLELSAYKHIYTQSRLMINVSQEDELNDLLDKLLWEDVFRPYGYLGGLGISYSYNF